MNADIYANSAALPLALTLHLTRNCYSDVTTGFSETTRSHLVEMLLALLGTCSWPSGCLSFLIPITEKVSHAPRCIPYVSHMERSIDSAYSPQCSRDSLIAVGTAHELFFALIEAGSTKTCPDPQSYIP